MSIKLLFEMMAKELSESQFSQWEYKLSTDPEVMLYDFYFLSKFLNDQNTGDEDLDYSLKLATKEVADGLQKHMIRAVKWALSCEFRHIIDGEGYQSDWRNSRKLNHKTKTFLEEYEDILTSTKKNKIVKLERVKKRVDTISNTKAEDYWQTGSRVSSYRSILSAMKNQNLNNSDFGEIAEDCFSRLKWDSGYGGKSWGRIAKGWVNLVNAKTTPDKFVWIDHVYDLQHNSDTVFDKVSLYYKAEARGNEDDKDDETGFAWLKAALDWKRDVTDIRQYYKLVSPPLKAVVAFISKKETGKTIESPMKNLHSPGEPQWKGIWRDGEWAGGTWADGTWEDGTWHNGNWRYGTWKKGTWLNGTWEMGTWEDGTWKGGTWVNGKWLSGKWIGGTWEVGNIWSKKFKRFVKSYANPKSFYKEEAKAKNITSLRDAI
jgi:hypothetical protein